jgi:L,D-peptidoglycan transpeptidase YkuD (ErfK/YbiS/YcfS/YnhG family)
MMRNHSLIAATIVPVLAGLLAACGPSTSPSATVHDRNGRNDAGATTSIPSPGAPPSSVAPAATTTAPPATAAPPTTAAQSDCGASLAEGLASTGAAAQLVTVVAVSSTSTYATLAAWQRDGPCWVRVFGPWGARIGGAGFSDNHVEGDDTTPTGAYGVGPVMYGNAPNPGVRYPYRQLVCGDWWDETSRSPAYNTFQYVPCGETPPFGGDSEALWTETVAYPSFAVIDYNTAPVVPGAGSAIFIHADDGSATDGCVSLPLGELDELLAWMDPASSPLVVMGPRSVIEGF